MYFFLRQYPLADSPYFNATLSSKDVELAKSRLSKFLVVGINEAYDASVQLLLTLTGVALRDDQIHLPASMTSTYSADHEALKARARSRPMSLILLCLLFIHTNRVSHQG